MNILKNKYCQMNRNSINYNSCVKVHVMKQEVARYAWKFLSSNARFMNSGDSTEVYWSEL